MNKPDNINKQMKENTKEFKKYLNILEPAIITGIALLLFLC